jgi:hypothetical protein
MPNTVLLSEVHPKGDKRVRFNPMDPVQQYHAQYRKLDTNLLQQAFRQRIKFVADHCQQNGDSLILRDHAATDYIPRTMSEIVSLLDSVQPDYRVLTVVTVRNPIDVYASLINRSWTRDMSFSKFCKRYVLFLQRYEGFPTYKYEDFVQQPELMLQSICADFEIEFSIDYKDNFMNWRMSGDSGRKSSTIKARPPRDQVASINVEAKNSSAFGEISERLGYSIGGCDLAD